MKGQLTALLDLDALLHIVANVQFSAGNRSKPLEVKQHVQRFVSNICTNATDKDADDNLIIDPQKANWNYSQKGGLNYKNNCCYFVIPSNNVALTFSSGIAHSKNSPKNSPFNIRSDLSIVDIDNKYENLIKTICSD